MPLGLQNDVIRRFAPKSPCPVNSPAGMVPWAPTAMMGITPPLLYREDCTGCRRSVHSERHLGKLVI